MNLNRLLIVSFFILVISTYQTDSGIILSLLLKVLLLKGALFMSMPLSIGAFMMGQGMGFFAGNMMGGYMMLKAANRYHNTEKYKWTSGYTTPHYSSYTKPHYPSGYGHGHHTTTSSGWGWKEPSKYAHAYDKGKSVGSAIAALNSHKLKLASALHQAKGHLAYFALGKANGLKSVKGGSGGYSKGPSSYHKRPPHNKGWGWGSASTISASDDLGGYGGGHGGYEYGAYSKQKPVVEDYKGSSDSYAHLLDAESYGAESSSGNIYKTPEGEIYKGQMVHSNYYPSGSVGSGHEAAGSSYAKVASNNFYTTVYDPGHEYTGELYR
jgi:hypothetical protein